MKHTLIGLIAITFSVQGEIASGYGTVPCNGNLSFSPYAVSQNTYPRTITHDGGNVYECSTAIGTIDLFIATYGMYVCSYICRNIAIGSPRPFYISRQPFTTQDFLRPLNPDDTARFIRCDTVRRDMHIQSMPEGDTTHCYLPHIDTSQNLASPVIPGCFLLLKTNSGKYAIALLDPVFSQGRDGGFTYTYLSDFQVRWHIQTDGTLNFSRLTGIKTRDSQNRVISPVFKGKRVSSPVVYNIKGQRISTNPHGLRKTAGVTLIITKTGVVRNFMN